MRGHRRAAVCLSVLLVTVLTVGCARRYTVRGMVLKVDPPARSVLISHDPVPGYMGAMVMPFSVPSDDDLHALHPGAQVDFQLVVRKGRSHLQNLRVREGAADGIVEDQGDRIILPEPPEKVALGALVPGFALTDQNGLVVKLSDLRGKVIAVNFIYTRCPLPEVCPRLSANFAALQRRFASRLGKDLMLLSVTLDPDHDTPTELLKYAKIWNARPEGWRFLTGPARDVEAVAGRFGMNYWPEEGLITHTSKTAVLSRDGRLSAIIDGSAYRARQLGDLIGKELEKQ